MRLASPDPGLGSCPLVERMVLESPPSSGGPESRALAPSRLPNILIRAFDYLIPLNHAGGYLSRQSKAFGEIRIKKAQHLDYNVPNAAKQN